MEDGAAEAWKVFGGDTEAGRLLKKLYGGTTKPKVSYPKLKIKPKEATSAPFIPGGGVVGADARTHRLVAKTSSRAIKAPAFTKGACPEMHPIEWLSTHKKPLKEIEKDVNEIKRQMEACRVSCVKRAPNQEKRRNSSMSFPTRQVAFYPVNSYQEQVSWTENCPTRLHFARGSSPRTV